MLRLKFNWIRDSLTPIYTELSKYWKKSHTPFEQFAHFLFFRDDRPCRQTKNMITHAQKPVLVAAIAGDVEAMVLLAELGFFVPPDYYWNLPFMDAARKAMDPAVHATLRHLGVYYYAKMMAQRMDIFNPIDPPEMS